jgi:predicted lipid-binding transport protein (Tim44 family)
MGAALLVLALAFGASLSMLLASFPLPILAGLLAIAGVLHIALLMDLEGRAHWALAIAVGVTGFLINLAVALLAALLIWWAAESFAAYRGGRNNAAAP